MKNSKLLAVALLAVAALAVAPPVVRAAVQGPTVTTTPIPSTLTDWAGHLSFPKFNPALGTLTDVTLQFSSALASTWTVTNSNSGSRTNGSVYIEMAVGVSDPALLITDQPQLDFDSPSHAYNLAPSGSASFGPFTSSETSGVYDYTAPGILSEFTGAGSIALSAQTLSTTWVSYHGGNVHVDQVTDASATGYVTYTYDPPAHVPEPSMFAIFGIGAIGLVGYILRRKRAV